MPKTTGYRIPTAKIWKANQPYQKVTHSPDDDETMNLGWNDEKRSKTEKENARRSGQRAIIVAHSERPGPRNNLTQPSTSTDIEMKDVDIQDGSDPSFSRLEEIEQCFIKQRGALALESMHFSMGEHVLLAHIHRQGGIGFLPAEDLRAFLKLCNKSRSLFR
jgi:hypothetical protein